MSSNSPTLYYFPYDGDNFMELCHDYGLVGKRKNSEKWKVVLFTEIDIQIIMRFLIKSKYYIMISNGL